MAAIITDDFRRNQARLLVDDIKASADTNFPTNPSSSSEVNWPYRANNRYAIGLGKTDPWPDNAGSIAEDAVDFVVPVPAGNRYEDDEVRNNLITLKDVIKADVKQLIAKNPWTSGRKYKVYDSADNDAFYSTGDLYPCYVTYSNSVYICLSNTAVDNGFTSVQASETAPNVGSSNYSFSQPAEGYVWCEVAKIPEGDSHTTNQFVPIRRDYDITGADVVSTTEQKYTAGLLSYVGIISGGSGYTSNTNITMSMTKHDGELIPATAFNVTCKAVIDGNGVIQRVDIRDPQNSPDDAGSYEYWTSGDAAGFVGNAVALTDRIKCVNFNITDSGGGSGAQLSATVAPWNGYAKHAIDILPTWFVGVNSTFTGTETDGDAPALKFRQVSLLKNFERTADGDGSLNILDTLKSITLGGTINSAITATLTPGDLLYQDTTNAVFIFDYLDGNDLYYHQNSTVGANEVDLVINEKVRVLQNMAQFASTVTAVNSAEYNSRTSDGERNGEVIFHENRKPFQRDGTQTEEVKLIIQL